MNTGRFSLREHDRSSNKRKECLMCSKELNIKNKSGYCSQCYGRSSRARKMFRCAICGVEFKAANSNAKTCSATCRSRCFIKKHKRTVYIDCAYCGTSFAMRGPYHKYCSSACRKKANNIKEYQDIKNVIKHRIRCRVNEFVQANNIKITGCIRYLGLKFDEFMSYLESKFKPGMSWANYGRFGWHIDHIKPLSSFDLTDIEQFKQACHYTNLQPLWAADNLSKSNKIGEEHDN